MHALSFLQKRLHLAATARGREMFAHIEDMTPARFDILYVMHQNVVEPDAIEANGYWISHRMLRERLGLARQTIWKAVKRLIQLGLVEAWEAISDPQCAVVRLTAEGIRRVRLAMNAAFSERAPLPAKAPVPEPGESLPRYWRHPELADSACIGSNGVISGEPQVIAHPGAIDRKYLRKTRPTPERPVVETIFVVPKKGREVARIFTSFVWKSLGARPGRRGKWWRHLNRLEEIIGFMTNLATALGNTAPCLYPLDY